MDDKVAVARQDHGLRAIVVERTPLRYAAGAAPDRDRPAHVRAASAIVAWRGGFAVVQDDAGFVAWVGPDGGVHALELPAGPDGRRQFDDTRGNKRHKLDLEAAFVLATADGDVMLGLGSGSTPARQRIVSVRLGDPPGEPHLHDGSALYDALRGVVPGELNIEGAVRIGPDVVRILQRGNGLGANDGTADVPAAWFRGLLDGHPGPLPALRARRWDLGLLAGARLGFTDGLDAHDGWWFLAAAEDSPDAVRDGPVTGSVIGRAGDHGGRWAPLCDPSGTLLPIKAEGICAGSGPHELLVVVDADDPDLPAEILRVVLQGPWT